MHGLLIIDKPAGLSSHDVIARARRILRTKRIGHTGTLDPFATGVLVLLIGNATRLAQFVNTDEKEYLAVARCGFATDTGDLTGTALKPTNDHQPIPRDGYSPEQIEQAMAPLRGQIRQIPPMYSAKKVGGQKLYEMARRGEEIEREPVQLHIRELEIDPTFSSAGNEQPEGSWDFAFRVICSSGTYIRTLAESIGANLCTGAHLTALRRTRAGSFDLNHAVTLEQLAAEMESNSVDRLILPPNAALDGMIEWNLDREQTQRAKNGMTIKRSGIEVPLPMGVRVALYDDNANLLGVGEYDAASLAVKPRVMMPTNSQ